MNQIQGEEWIALSRQQVNQLIPSLESAYYGLILQGKYLPKLNSSIITSEYFLGVLFETDYVQKIDEINIGVLLKPIKKLELIEELLKILDQRTKMGNRCKTHSKQGMDCQCVKNIKTRQLCFQNAIRYCKI